MQHKVALIPGDGIGPEVAEQAVRILNATGVQIEWEPVEAGHGISMKYGGDPLPETTLASIRRHRVALKAPLTTEELIVDNACMQLVRDPTRFDVLLMANLYGDIISDLGAGLVGGLGVVPGANIGDEYAVFEAVHGSAPDIAGKGIANPLAMTMSGGMMLRHLGEDKAALALDEAVRLVLKTGKRVTRDLGGTASTREMADALIDQLTGV